LVRFDGARRGRQGDGVGQALDQRGEVDRRFGEANL